MVPTTSIRTPLLVLLVVLAGCVREESAARLNTTMGQQVVNEYRELEGAWFTAWLLRLLGTATDNSDLATTAVVHTDPIPQTRLRTPAGQELEMGSVFNVLSRACCAPHTAPAYTSDHPPAMLGEFHAFLNAHGLPPHPSADPGGRPTRISDIVLTTGKQKVYADIYSPNTDNPESLMQGIRSKLGHAPGQRPQAATLIVNLTDSGISVRQAMDRVGRELPGLTNLHQIFFLKGQVHASTQARLPRLLQSPAVRPEHLHYLGESRWENPTPNEAAAAGIAQLRRETRLEHSLRQHHPVEMDAGILTVSRLDERYRIDHGMEILDEAGLTRLLQPILNQRWYRLKNLNVQNYSLDGRPRSGVHLKRAYDRPVPIGPPPQTTAPKPKKKKKKKSPKPVDEGESSHAGGQASEDEGDDFHTPAASEADEMEFFEVEEPPTEGDGGLFGTLRTLSRWAACHLRGNGS